MKNNIKKWEIIIIGIIVVVALIGGVIIIKGKKKEKTPVKITNSLKDERIMSDGTYQIRFSDLVSVSSLEEYNNKEVTAVGYLSPVASYDGSFGYLMNLPYQTCPYCQPSDTKITNTISIFAKKGEKIEFTEAAVIVKGILKLEDYTDEYGYTYNYRIVDSEITVADTSEVREKISLYNDLADKKILTGIMELLYAIDNNLYYDEYVQSGYEIERKDVDLTAINQVIEDLKDFDKTKVETLVNVSSKVKTIGEETNAIIEKKEYKKLEQYQEQLYNLFVELNGWLAEYQL